MNRDEIIRLAMKAGLLDKVDCSDDYFIPGDAFVDEIEAFAKLVAETEREQCEKACEDLLAEIPLCGVTENYSGEYFHEDVFYAEGIDDCIEAIRTRGEP
jgi:hypothetical protein